MSFLVTKQSQGKLKKLRARFGKIQDVADLVPCSRPVVYFALENPRRYSRVSRRLNELLNDK
jgi:hypothetical protein